eukprot:383913-Pelagomonas_calceolata.AAC.1
MSRAAVAAEDLCIATLPGIFTHHSDIPSNKMYSCSLQPSYLFALFFASPNFNSLSVYTCTQGTPVSA